MPPESNESNVMPVEQRRRGAGSTSPNAKQASHGSQTFETIESSRHNSVTYQSVETN